MGRLYLTKKLKSVNIINMPKSQKTSKAPRASKKNQEVSKSTLFAKLRDRYYNLETHQQASIKRAAILAVLFLVFMATYAYRKHNEAQIVYFSDNEIAITDTDYSVELVEYQGSNFTMQIPKGWKVETTGQAETTAVYVYNPDDKRYSIYYQFQSKPLMRNYDERNVYARYANVDSDKYGVYTYAPVIRLGDMESFYTNFNAYTDNVQSYKIEFADFHFPKLTNFTKTDISQNKTSFGTQANNDSTLRATFSTADITEVSPENRGEGIFTGTVINYDSSDIAGYYIIYGAAFISTPEDLLVAYQPSLIKSLKSLKFNDEFIASATAAETWDENATDPNNMIQESAENIAKLWKNRDISYDTLRQKHVDTRDNYERVWDLENEKSYQAFKGFMAGYTGNRFRAVTNEEYARAPAGVIKYQPPQSDN